MENLADANDELMALSDLLTRADAIDRIPDDEAESLKMFSETLLRSGCRLMGQL
jgi:hypothetical protein